MKNALEEMFEQSDEQLYATLGRSLPQRALGFGPQSDEESEEDGRSWLSSHREEVAKRICGSQAVQAYLTSERAKNRILIAACIADMISSMVLGFGAFAVGVLIVREGLESLCTPGS